MSYFVSMRGVRENIPDVDYSSGDIKSRLVDEICNMPRRSIPCAHHHHHRPNPILPRVDWYQVLQVEEDAGAHAIKKQYHKLALLLHPDKNNHPNAQAAFNLVSEAYACLSDEIKRNKLNLDRWRSICTKCTNKRTPTASNPHHHNTASRPDRGLNIPPDGGQTRRAVSTVQQQQRYSLKDFKEQMAEEARVIQRCLKINRGSRNVDYPIFNPSDYVRYGYPHRIKSERRYPQTTDQGLRCFWRRDLPCYTMPRRGRCETPVFELRRAESCNVSSQSACSCIS